MRSGKTPFKFDIGLLPTRARHLASDASGDITLRLPFGSIAVRCWFASVIPTPYLCSSGSMFASMSVVKF